jgi:hypothetical protein
MALGYAAWAALFDGDGRVPHEYRVRKTAFLHVCPRDLSLCPWRLLEIGGGGSFSLSLSLSLCLSLCLCLSLSLSRSLALSLSRSLALSLSRSLALSLSRSLCFARSCSSYTGSPAAAWLPISRQGMAPEARPTAWKFLLGVFAFSSTAVERARLLEEYRWGAPVLALARGCFRELLCSPVGRGSAIYASLCQRAEALAAAHDTAFLDSSKIIGAGPARVPRGAYTLPGLQIKMSPARTGTIRTLLGSTTRIWRSFGAY